jgi:hypothetical protein
LYTAKIPFKDFTGKARGTATIQFNLTEREIFKLLLQFQSIFKWQDKLKQNPDAETPTEEVIAFYTNFEDIILAAYGQLSDDGLYFRKDDRFNFEDSAMFAAAMAYYVSDVRETSKLIEGLMPKGLEDIVKKADESLAELAADPSTEAELRAELARLRAAQAPAEDPAA